MLNQHTLKLLLLKLLLFNSIFLVAQKNIKRIENISATHELSDRTVIDIVQDRTGFLWMANNNGLNRYDGHDFIFYDNNPRNPKRIFGNDIKKIHIDENNDVVIIYNENYEFIDLLQSDSAKTKTLFLQPKNGIRGITKAIHVQENGGIYILSVNQDSIFISRYLEGSTFKPIFNIPAPVVNDQLNYQFLITKDQSCWLYLNSAGLLKIDSTGIIYPKFSGQPYNSREHTAGSPQSLSIHYEDAQQRLWVAFSGQKGMYLYHPDSSRFELFQELPGNEYYTDLWEDDLGNLIFSVSNTSRAIKELFFLNVKEDLLDFSFLLEEEDKINVISGKDFNGTLFLGTYVGVIKVVQKDRNIKNILSQEVAEGDWGYSIRGIAEDQEGNIFIAREVSRWYELDAQKKELLEITLKNTETGQITEFGCSFDLKLDKNGFIWGTSCDTNGFFLHKLNPKTKEIKSYPYPVIIRDFIIGNDGLVWLVGSMKNAPGRLAAFNPATEKFNSPYSNKDGTNPLEEFNPLFLMEGENGLLWIGTHTGLYCIDRQKETSSLLQVQAETPQNSLSNNYILVIYEDPSGLLYLGTRGGGLNILNPTTGRIKVYDQQDGLANNIVCGILPDEKGNYWISTFNGLSYFDTQHESFSNFYTSDGLSHNEFNRFSFFKDRAGVFYFGGMNGLNIFRSEDLLKPKPNLPLCLTGFSRYNSKQQELIEEDTDLKNRRKFRISPYDSYFQFNFALLDFSQPEKNQYKYWLEGYDKDWTYLSNTPFIRFNKLPAGNYTLHIIAADSNGNWSENELNLQIKIEEFFYKTIWAYLLYALILLVGIYFIYRFQLNRKLEHAETLKLKELDQLKSRLYANITHEFRTPLTLISGPANQAITNIDTLSKNELLKDLKLISRNSQHLLQLVNQMLDLNKLDAGNMRAEFVKGDVIAYLKYIADSFSSYTNSKKIEFIFYAENDHLLMDYDKQKLFQIISNLLINAIKFTPENGQVIIHTGVKDDLFFLKVKDNGIGIDREHLPHIFNRFYQGNTDAHKSGGTGIGLALCKELAHLLKGTLTVESEVHKGTTFQLLLPIHQNAELEEEAKSLEELSAIMAFLEDGKDILKEDTLDTGKANVPQILIIEDHVDVAQYIANCLRDDYSLLFAKNGQVGIDKALEFVPDIILCDVMMPEKDGFEVCQTLKNDQRSSHIPIILLTALADNTSKIKGLKRGADAYLAKPFDENELLIRIEKLLELRETLQQKYGHSILNEEIEPKVVDEIEDVFLQKVKSIIEEYLTDHNFNITRLCKEIGMSRTQLHRKFTALTGESATKFIRSVRLAKAKALLANSNLTIAEVAYDTGFSDPNYFSRLFTRAFGYNPSEHRDKG